MTRTLIEKLEQADGPSRELDAAIFEQVVKANRIALDFSAYTSSLDAAVALVERVLPRHRWVIANRTGPKVGGSASVYRDDSLKTAEAPTPALALCIALLKALEARED